MSAPRIGILALQGDFAEHRAAFERCGCPTELVRLPAELERVQALVIPGGESTTMSRLLRVFDLEEPLRHRLAEGLPCFATCAGLILLSRDIVDGRPDQLALGALDISVRRNGYGRQVESFEKDIPIAAIGAPAFHATFIRAPRVLQAGPDVDVVAAFEGDPVAVRQGPHLALAFHPELADDDRLHRLFLRETGLGVASAA